MRKKVRTFFKSNFNIDFEFRPILQKTEEAISLIIQTNPNENIQKIRNTILEIIEDTGLEGIKKSHLIKNGKIFLQKLSQKKRIAAFTRSGLKEANLAFNIHKIENFFELVITRDNNIKVKPEPDQIVMISDKLKVKPERILVVGDHPYDILAGKKAGTKTLGVLSGIAPKEDLIKAGADSILESVTDLEEFI